MSASRLAKTIRMAAPAAILVLLPGMAMAGVCDNATFNIANHIPALDSFLKGHAEGDQYRKFFTPESLITVGVLLWLIFSSSTRATKAAIAWFLALAAYSAYLWFSIDLTQPYYQAAIADGCVEPTPRHILSNLGFAVLAGLLTWQRIRRQKAA
jgi:hypothetical protein